MKYLCTVYFAPGALGALSASEHAELDRRSIAYDKDLERRGHRIASEALAPAAAAKTVRVRRRRPSVTDGPFAETKEVLGGFLFIEARDLGEAVQLMKDCPIAEFGSIEVRPILEIPERPHAG